MWSPWDNPRPFGKPGPFNIPGPIINRRRNSAIIANRYKLKFWMIMDGI
jgi:hypothetical protein